MNLPACPTPFQFVSKAQTLLALEQFPELNIPQPFVFTMKEWQKDADALLARIVDAFAPMQLAIRSSCGREDTLQTSAAGAFLSVLNVSACDASAIRAACEQVIASYGAPDPDDQVLVQPMVMDSVLTGVIMTRSLHDGAHYYVINYDDESGKTDTITGGVNISKTVYVYRNVRDDDFDSDRLRRIVGLAKRVEEICGNDSLDIEFCQDREDSLHLLQVHPICASRHWCESVHAVNDYISNVADFVAAKTASRDNLYGSRSILGIMPDWNPAEMIGILPYPLAASLYREIITSRVWSSARARMGYNAVAASELMLIIAGHPYIDVRASFNSFLPAHLDPVTSEALISAWIEYLGANPQYHDKVEFEVALTCLDFCFEQNLSDRYNGLLTAKRRQSFREALAGITARAMSPGSTLQDSLERITELRARHAGRPLLATRYAISQIGDLLAECRKYGTLPFSILARHAFIAESLLRTAVGRGALEPERLARFKRSIGTISGELSADFMAVCAGGRTARSFIDKYGHLRPGSYDILSPRYADRENLFAGSGVLQSIPRQESGFVLTDAERRGLTALLTEADLPYNADDLLAYAAKAIAGRELGKFVFSRNLSDALESIAQWAETLGLGREDAAFIPVQAILDHGYSVGV